MPRNNPLFQEAERQADIQTPQVQAPDRAQAILAEGSAAAKLTGAIGQTVGAGLQAWKTWEDQIDATDTVSATSDWKMRSQSQKSKMDSLRNKLEVTKLHNDYLASIRKYTTEENDSGVRKLRSENRRNWYSNEYAQGLKNNAILMYEDKLRQIDQTDNDVKYKVSRDRLVSAATSPESVQANAVSLRVLHEANLSAEQAKIAIEEDTRNMAFNSIINQSNFMLSAIDYTPADAEASAEALMEQTGLYDFTPEQQIKLEESINRNVSRVKTRDAAARSTSSSQLDADQRSSKNSLYEMIRTIKDDRTSAERVAIQMQQAIDTAPLESKDKLHFENLLREITQPKIKDSDPFAIQTMDELEADPNVTTKELEDELDKLSRNGKINGGDAAVRNKRYQTRAEGQQKEVLKAFDASFRQRVALGETVTVREQPSVFRRNSKLEEDAKKLNAQMTQLGIWAKEWQQANPDATLGDLQNKFAKEITDVSTYGASLSLSEAILKSIETSNKAETSRLLEEGTAARARIKALQDQSRTINNQSESTRLLERLNRKKEYRAQLESERSAAQNSAKSGGK